MHCWPKVSDPESECFVAPLQLAQGQLCVLLDCVSLSSAQLIHVMDMT